MAGSRLAFGPEAETQPASKPPKGAVTGGGVAGC